MSTQTETQLDVRAIEPSQRHTQIFGQLDALREGQALQIVNDHDPKPLRYQLDARSPGQFQWTYLQSGPAEWRVRISKLSAQARAHIEDGCCSGGACSG
ncbi:MAG TPA: DUF2249 domain-containing protein [Rubrivivax sp.]|nr:DUF2249 domain-containing protein [Burkholderiales bacterium]HNU09750.1 DUF2249 domain-containing protein [Rubrivivax sp.]